MQHKFNEVSCVEVVSRWWSHLANGEWRGERDYRPASRHLVTCTVEQAPGVWELRQPSTRSWIVVMLIVVSEP